MFWWLNRPKFRINRGCTLAHTFTVADESNSCMSLSKSYVFKHLFFLSWCYTISSSIDVLVIALFRLFIDRPYFRLVVSLKLDTSVINFWEIMTAQFCVEGSVVIDLLGRLCRYLWTSRTNKETFLTSEVVIGMDSKAHPLVLRYINFRSRSVSHY